MNVDYISVFKKASHNLPITDISDTYDEEKLASKIIVEGGVETHTTITSRGKDALYNSIAPIIEVQGMSPMAKDNWLHSFSHKET